MMLGSDWLYSLCLGMLASITIGGVHGGEVPQVQISGLYSLYESTIGENWTWQTNYSVHGIPWNFSSNVNSIFVNNPCQDNWQGLTCTTNCTTDIAMAVCDILEITLSDYNMFGTLSTGLTQLTALVDLDLSANSLYGTLPSVYGNITTLQSLSLSDNQLSGTLPKEWANISGLLSLDFDNNQLSGTMPSEYASMENMIAMIFTFNADLTGTIPPEYGVMSQMRIFSFASNKMYGSVPETLASFQDAIVFSVRDNSFSGSFPQTLMALPKIYYMLLNDNFFTGNFDGVEFSSSSLTLLRLNNNLFTGGFVLPALCYKHRLRELLLNDNTFSGSLPSCIGGWNRLEALDLSNNHFTGTLPSSFIAVDSLAVLVLYANMFTGQVGNKLNTTHLSAAIIGDNQFTGALPADLFNSSVLDTFIGSKNCFTGSLPSEICLAQSLKTLAVSGITAASSCAKRLAFGSYMIRPVPGGLPECLFSMPHLTQLFAAGNSLKGTLHPIPSDSKLQNLTLSYNRLYGAIPLSIQQHTRFDTLDLSFNELVGTIEHMTNYSLLLPGDGDGDADVVATAANGFGTSEGGGGAAAGGVVSASAVYSNIILERNALSGHIPSSFTHATTTINILSGNMFQCRTPASLPQGDPRAHTYSCGSQLLDFYATLWGVLFVSLLSMALLWFYAYPNTHLASLTAASKGRFTLTDTIRVSFRLLFYRQDIRGSICEASASASELIRYSHLILNQFRTFCFLITLIILVVFLPAFALLSASAESKSETQTYQYGWGISMAFLKGVNAGAIVTTLWGLLLLFCMYYEVKFIDRSPLVAEDEQIRRKSSSKWRKYVIFVVNVAVTLAANSAYVYVMLTQSFTMQLMASLLLVLYKLCLVYLVLVPWLESVDSKYVVILSVMICNVIIVPMLATLAADVSCYQSLFIHAPPVSTEYSYPTCDAFGYQGAVTCLSYVWNVLTVAIPVPFVYSDLCYTAVITNYVPIYIMTYGVIGMLIPVSQILMTIQFANAKSTNRQWLVRLVTYLKTIEWFPLYYLLPLERREDMISSIDQLHRKHLYLSRFNSFNCVLLLTLLLTFGVAYSPLAVMLLFNITLTTLAFQLSIYYHSLQISDLPADCMDVWYLVLVDEIKDMHKIIFGSRTAIYIFSSLFVAFGLFEMVATSNFAVSLVLMILIVLCTSLGAHALKYHRRVSLKRVKELAHIEQMLAEGQKTLSDIARGVVDVSDVGGNTSATARSRSRSGSRSRSRSRSGSGSGDVHGIELAVLSSSDDIKEKNRTSASASASASLNTSGNDSGTTTDIGVSTTTTLEKTDARTTASGGGRSGSNGLGGADMDNTEATDDAVMNPMMP